jgi:hypothetical protein
MSIDKSRLDALVEERLVKRDKHPDADLYIYNYADRVQYDRLWTDELMQCRGLILNGEGDVVARPFRKFFNFGEHQGTLPDGPYEVWRKYDGSLGILYWWGNVPMIATRGNFSGVQAKTANNLLYKQYETHRLDRAITWLFEIIYPENRIVVDYGKTRELRLLGGYVTATGEWVPPDASLGFPIAEMLTVCDPDTDPSTWSAIGDANEEGYVLRWPSSDFRLKVKLEEYLRVHRLITGVSAKHIWELLRDVGPEALDEYLDRVPDEFAEWVKNIGDGLRSQYEQIKAECEAVFEQRPLDLPRKDVAAFFTKHRYPHVLFSMLDGKPYAPGIWKVLEPRAVMPFMKDEA